MASPQPPGHPKPAGRGRPRDVENDTKILGAALDLLRDEGYEGMSIEGVARAAGVTRPTVYRRWPSKEELASAAVESLITSEGDYVESDDPWADLQAELERFHAAVGRPNGLALIATVLAEENRTPQLLKVFRARVADTRRAKVRHALERAFAQDPPRAGESVDLEDLLRMALGYYYAARIGSSDVDEDWPARVVQVLRSLTT